MNIVLKTEALKYAKIISISFYYTDIVHVAQPISTRNLYYTSSLCFIPDSVDCADSRANDSKLIFKRESYGDCNKPNYLFILENDGTLRHQCSGKVVCPDSSNYLSLKSQCPDDKGKYNRLAVKKPCLITQFFFLREFLAVLMLQPYVDFRHDCHFLIIHK